MTNYLFKSTTQNHSPTITDQLDSGTDGTPVALEPTQIECQTPVTTPLANLQDDEDDNDVLVFAFLLL
jgi:hypothetical protein